MEDPGYQRLSKIYEKNDVAIHHIPMDQGGVIPEKLEESGAEILHITPSHHFPTGIVMPVSRRYELLSWASKGENRYIIEDDYDCEFRLAGRPIPTLQSIDVMEKVIYINTFSKSLAPASGSATWCCLAIWSPGSMRPWGSIRGPSPAWSR